MKIKNLYTFKGAVDSNGNYKYDNSIRSIIAECVDDNVDHGCYYFSFWQEPIEQRYNSRSFNFIEIPNLLTFINKENNAYLHKFEVNEETKVSFETYISELYEARKKLLKNNFSSNNPNKK